MKLGWHAPSFPVDGTAAADFPAQVERGLEAVGGRFDSVWFDDHLHPWADFVAADTPTLECLTTIAYLAGRHPSLAFGSTVVCQSFRNAGLLAKMAANLHWLTGGRFVLGIGAGWLADEYRAYGYDFPGAAERIAQLEEAVQVVRAAWTRSPASFDGSFSRLDGAYAEPRPDPAPPLLIGGGGEKRTLRVVARHADWWNIPGGTPETYAHKLDVLRGHCEAVGRDYDDIVKTWSAEVVAVAASEEQARAIADASPYTDDNPIVGTPDSVVEQLRPYLDLGVEHLIVRLVDFPSTEGLRLFADEVAPNLGEA